jgi:hypothetical protein
MDTSTPTAPSRQRKPRPKPARSVSLLFPAAGAAPAVVRLTVGKESADYTVTPIPADYGRGFLVEKTGIDSEPASYHVNIDGDKKSCDCKGFTRWGYCKHADGLAALVAAGRL